MENGIKEDYDEFVNRVKDEMEEEETKCLVPGILLSAVFMATVITIVATIIAATIYHESIQKAWRISMTTYETSLAVFTATFLGIYLYKKYLQ